MAMLNQIKTVILLGLLTGILLGIGSLWGSYGLTIALAFSIIMNFGAYWFSDKIALAMYRAKPVTEKEEPKLYRIIREVSQKAKIPMPRVYVIPASFANAFATGRSPKNSAIAVTRGILELLNEEELKGVIAHEISHIKNRDTLIQSVAAMIAGVISYIAFVARWGAVFWGARDREGNGAYILELLFLVILAPLLATIIRLAISRSREFLADESGARILHSGYGLASALEKLERATQRIALRPNMQTGATAHLFITNPFKGRAILNLFMTHPPTEVRVKRLRSMRF